jgi:hypothetical protein
LQPSGKPVPKAKQVKAKQKQVTIQRQQPILRQQPIIRSNKPAVNGGHLNSGKGKSDTRIFTVTRKEYFGPLNNAVSAPFTPTVHRLSATGSLVSQWLSNIGFCFDLYRFREVRIDYVPTTSELNAQGAIYLGFDPDAAENPEQDMITRAYIENMACKTMSLVSRPCSLVIPKSAYEQDWYFNGLAGVSGGDETGSRLDTAGLIYIANSDTRTGVNIGEIFISYTVDFRLPEISVLPPNLWNGGRPEGSSGKAPIVSFDGGTIPTVSPPWPDPVSLGNNVKIENGLYNLDVHTSKPSDAGGGLSFSMPPGVYATNLWNIISASGSSATFLINCVYAGVFAMVTSAIGTWRYHVTITKQSTSTLPGLAKRYGVNYADLCDALHIKPDKLALPLATPLFKPVPQLTRRRSISPSQSHCSDLEDVASGLTIVSTKPSTQQGRRTRVE